MPPGRALAITNHCGVRWSTLNLTHQLNLLWTPIAQNLKDFFGFSELTVGVIRCRPKNPKKSFTYPSRSRDDSTDVLG